MDEEKKETKEVKEKPKYMLRPATKSRPFYLISRTESETEHFYFWKSRTKLWNSIKKKYQITETFKIITRVVPKDVKSCQREFVSKSETVLFTRRIGIGE